MGALDQGKAPRIVRMRSMNPTINRLRAPSTMKPVIATLFSLFLLTTGLAASARTHDLPADITVVPLAGITNDRDTSVSYLNLMLNRQATVRGFYLQTDPSGDAHALKPRHAASDKVYWLKSVESGDGVVLGQGQGVKAILLRGTVDSQAGKGSLEIKYVTNGIFMNYDKCKVRLQRVGNRNWELVNAYNGHPVKHIEVRTWFLGISTLANVCPATNS